MFQTKYPNEVASHEHNLGLDWSSTSSIFPAWWCVIEMMAKIGFCRPGYVVVHTREIIKIK